jgi:GH15 family glucan-1,4-alpha-glucosidase
MRSSSYRPIADYAAIGNLHSAALIAPDGSIDWACLPDFDSPSYFAAILDSRKGGYFRVRPAASTDGRQQYVESTNVLETVFETADGRLVLTDFMPLWGDINGRSETATTRPEIHRLLHAEGDGLEVDIEWAPRPDYARGEVRLERVRGGYEAAAAGHRLLLAGLPDDAQAEIRDQDGPVLRARVALRSGQRLALVTGLADDSLEPSAYDSLEELHRTVETWRAWVHKEGSRDRRWAQPNQALVARSELALKLMSYAPTGAIVAAPTTSLPEGIGGVRNWDYRYTWIRDASLTVQAMHALGHRAEARDFIEWAEDVARQKTDSPLRVQLMYGIRGETVAPEEMLDDLEGYRGSRPVRIGNEAAMQKQLDIYGELIDGAYELVREGHELGPEVTGFLASLADAAAGSLNEADDGIWEMRRGSRRFTYSQLMLWVALHRAVLLAERHGLEGDVDRWREKRDEARALVLKEGYDEARGAFTQTFGDPDLDAALLLLPLHEMLPFEDPRVQSTIDRILEELTEHDLVYRYHADDGLPGEEGAFVLCSFWMVDALALSGRLDEAHRMFDSLVRRANHVGLYSEQIDPRTGLFLGNFPQAFSHLGLLNSALYLAHADGRETPVPAPVGSKEHRELVGAPT